MLTRLLELVFNESEVHRKLRRKQSRKPLLGVEELEARDVPALYKWNYTGQGWGDNLPANWLVQSGTQWVQPTANPGASDDVWFEPSTAGKAQFTDPGTWKSLKYETVRTLRVEGNLTLLNGGEFKAGEIERWNSGDIFVKGGTFTWTVGGSWTGLRGGKLVVETTAGNPATQFVVSELGSNSMSRSIEVRGGSKMSLEGSIAAPSIAGISIWSGATLDLKPTLGYLDGTGVIENSGIITFDSPNSFESTLALVNYGTFSAKRSTINFSTQGAQSGFSVVNQAGGFLDITAGATLKAPFGVNMNSGELRQFGAGTAWLDGNLTVHGGHIWFGQGGGVTDV